MVEGVSEIVQGSILAGTPASHEADIFVRGLQQIIISHDKMLQNSYKDTINSHDSWSGAQHGGSWSSNMRCHLYLQVCLYATLERFQIMFTQIKTFQLLRSALPDPLPQITSVSIALTPLIYHVQVHCMISTFLCSIYTKYKTEIFS